MTGDDHDDLPKCTVCGEPCEGRVFVEVGAMTIVDAEGDAMQIVPVDPPRMFGSWQDLNGPLVHADCLANLCLGATIDIDHSRRRGEFEMPDGGIEQPE